MCFASIDCGEAVTPHNILSLGDRLHVTRVYTRPIMTKVVYPQTFRDRAAKSFIGEAVSLYYPLVISKLAIAFTIFTSNPFPALIGASPIYLGPEPLLSVHRSPAHSSHRCSLSWSRATTECFSQ